ncbi:MAG: amidophosphoribosyltransferase [Candidatus Omnitrophica bacterium]|nr:amidophosphoribosyltransferase [Candidatus Omnitrophota bacterium]MCM8776798.1 amidophosphoribosyltransferase [Candidatus Omnitrophota bacterium]
MEENCGVFGLFSADKQVVKDIYYGIFKLQHRGQRYCGIATYSSADIHIITHKGFVRHTFTEEDLHLLKGAVGIGHVSLKDRQPVILISRMGKFAIAFSGNILNSIKLRNQLKNEGHSFSSETDIELLGKLISYEKDFLNGMIRLSEKVKGAYSIVMLTKDGIYAARDPYGFKPLILGKKDGSLAVSSESRAFDILGMEILRDVEPGEIIFISKKGLNTLTKIKNSQPAFCAFEWAYTASIDSVIEGIPVIRARENFGKKLAEKDKNMSADLVAPVPFSGIGCALGYHHSSGIPYEEVFLIDRFASRSYTPLTQESRDEEARIKLSVIKENVRGKKIVLCDDSIVRGTQIQFKVMELKNAGAKEVHVRIACPPLVAPCFYGISTRSYRELAAKKFSVDGIRERIGADSLKYNTLDDFIDAIGLHKDHLCLSCFTGKRVEER